jgi:hypothetical protein
MHPDEATFESYIWGTIDGPERKALETHVAGCAHCMQRLDAYADAASTPRAGTGADRRTEPRFSFHASAFINLLEPTMPERLPAEVVEVSRGGLKLRTVQFILPGALIMLRVGTEHLFGEVRYCVPSGSDFQVGVRAANSDVCEFFRVWKENTPGSTTFSTKAPTIPTKRIAKSSARAA